MKKCVVLLLTFFFFSWIPFVAFGQDGDLPGPSDLSEIPEDEEDCTVVNGNTLSLGEGGDAEGGGGEGEGAPGEAVGT